MTYSPAFFDLQLTFARSLTVKFGISLSDALYTYTTLSRTLGVADQWQSFVADLNQTPDPATWMYQIFILRHAHEQPLQPDDAHYYGYPLFGCFYFLVRDTSTIRPHFVKNDMPGMRPLSHIRAATRRAELGRMFGYIRQHVPAATIVLGNSWRYNLEAYRRLYPPAYTNTMPASDEDEFLFLALWGQCYDMAWQVKDDVAHELLQRVDKLTNLSALRYCFPYRILQPRCSIEEFYAFYDVT